MTFPPDHAGARVRPSPNFGQRLRFERPDMIVLHYTGMESGQAAEDWLCRPESQVSSHYLVHEDGEVVQMVRERDRAWHAGRSYWRGETDTNSRSIGIEIVNPGHALGYRDFPDIQIDAVIALCRGIANRHRITADMVLAHSDVAPGRKVDPGERFPWKRLHEAGIGLWPAPATIGAVQQVTMPDPQELRRLLSQVGYNPDLSAVPLETLISAFQLHFRPECVDGTADASTILALSSIASMVDWHSGL